jgi:hypothetical protein
MVTPQMNGSYQPSLPDGRQALDLFVSSFIILNE